ncbi:MAG: type II toxin-antitoxin system PemK/MazF family toxin [Bacillota bacterium]|nr:type II toxin-antitoxin system PemK/MazF family toxin [Bacillota bacterium]
MVLLKDDSNALSTIKGKLASIVSELNEVDSSKAVELCDWYLEKAKYFNKHYKKERFQKLPQDIKRGDIVWVHMGINIGDEFSDHSTKGHFGLVWGQQGFMFHIIPLSKQGGPKSNTYIVDLGKIPGLPDNNTFAKLDNIRAVSIRRIKRIAGQPGGKIDLNTVDPTLVTKINDTVKDKFVI